MKQTATQGYTLLEMAIAMAVLSMLTGMLLTMLTGQQEAKALKAQKEQMKLLDEALAYHVKLRGRLPCPANPALAETDANFAREDCTLATVSGGGSTNEDIYIGMIPTRTLNLSDRMLYDQWGSRISYAVIALLTMDSASFAAYTTTEDTGVIHIMDAARNQVTEVTNEGVVAYALISHGKDKKGAYNRVGQITDACGVPGTDELDAENCDNLDNEFIDAELIDSRFAASFYHDIIRWRDLAQLKDAVEVDSAITYITIVSDTGNNRVLQFNPDGTFLSALDSSTCATNTTFNAPQGIAVDNANNIYVADTGNNVVKKFDSDGNCTEFDGDTQSGDFNPSYLAVASDGKMYVMDPDDNRVIILNTAGSYNSQFNGTGSSGTFNAPSGIAIDSNDNLYVADTGNNLVKKFNSAGVYDGVEIDGTGGTVFTGPTGVALDGSILLIADNTLDSVQKFDATGTYISVLDDSGNLSAPQTVAVNGRGDVSILDTGNNMVKIFSRNASSLGSINAADAPAPTGFSGPMGIGVMRQ